MKNKFSNIKERILYLAENVEVSKQEFFRKINITYGNFTGDKKNRPINSDALENILLIYPQTNPYWLLMGKGNMFKDTVKQLERTDSNDEENYVIELQKKHIEKLENEIEQLKEKVKELSKEDKAIKRKPYPVDDTYTNIAAEHKPELKKK